MVIILGIESTAHTFGVGIVRNGKILSNVKSMYSTEKGGIIPIESAKHHSLVAQEIYNKAIEEANSSKLGQVKEKDIDAVAFSQGPGLSPCLLEGMKFTKHICKKLNVPLVPVNHCVAHLEIGKITGAKDPVLLYVSGANTQIIAYESGKYRIFGETLDLGVGNFIDTFARYLSLGFPGGPQIEQLALKSKNYIELPYTVKGMDIALSGILTNLRQKIEKMNRPGNSSHLLTPTTNPNNLRPVHNLHSFNTRDINGSEQTLSSSSLKKIVKVKSLGSLDKQSPQNFSINNLNKIRASDRKIRPSLAKLERDNLINFTKEDLAFSMQETVFAMLVEVAERALAHTGKKELVLGGGVACNSRLQEMCKIMCKEREAKMFVPEKSLLIDNATMIAYLGEIMFKSGIKIMPKNLDKVDIKPRQRTDEVEVSWKV